MNKTFYTAIFILLFALLFSACSDVKESNVEWEWPDPPKLEKIPVAEKPKMLWIDAGANFKYLANNREAVNYYLDLAKETGFDEVVVDVKPACGDVLYNSDIVPQVKRLGDVERVDTWDYLGAFIEEAHKRGLKVTASINAMLGGTTQDGGLLLRDPSKKHWATTVYKPSGLMSIMDDHSEPHKFCNPLHPEVQDYVLKVVEELVTKYPDLDGIAYDYCRYMNIKADFSDLSREKFEEHIGEKVNRFPEDIFVWNGTQVSQGKHYKKWLEFRASVIYDMFVKTKAKVKSINPNINFGTYTGCWYSSYEENGVNWASQNFDASKYYSWATPEYKNYGYAALLDFYMTGAYGETLYGSKENEWTVQGGILKAQQVVMGDVRVVGGLYGLNFYNKPNDCEEAVYIALTTGDGLMFFDMIYLIMYDQWINVEKGINKALATDK